MFTNFPKSNHHQRIRISPTNGENTCPFLGHELTTSKMMDTSEDQRMIVDKRVPLPSPSWHQT